MKPILVQLTIYELGHERDSEGHFAVFWGENDAFLNQTTSQRTQS